MDSYRTTAGFPGPARLSLAIIAATSLMFQGFGFSMIAAGQESQASNDRLSGGAAVSSLMAIASKQGVLLKWKTSFELDNAGFNVYREREGNRVRVNREIILGSAFIVGQNVPLRAGYSYSWFDSAGTAGYSYSIEAIGLDGAIKSLGKVVPQWGDKIPVETQLVDSNNLGTSGWPTPQREYLAGSAEIAAEGQIEDQWAIASQAALKISVKKAGWYRVTQQQINAAGFTAVVDIANLQLFNRARELAILTNRSTGQFVDGDFLEFYGQGVDTPTTDTNIYYLVAGTTAGKRIATGRKIVRGGVRSESGLPSPPVQQSGLLSDLEFDPNAWFWWIPRVAEVGAMPAAPKKTGEKLVESPPAPGKKVLRKARSRRRLKRHHYAHVLSRVAISANADSFDYTVEKKDRIVYFVSLLNGETENFFGQVISSSPVIQNLTIPNLETTATRPATLEIALQGASSANHVIAVQINNISVATIAFSGLAHKVQTFQIPLSQLTNGDNTIKFTSTAGSGLSIVDYVRLTYPHSYHADNDSLRFSLAPSQSARVDGFSTSSVRVIDYTDPFAVKLIKPLVESNGSSYTIQVPAISVQSAPPRLVYAIPEGGADQSTVLSLNQPSSLNRATNGADLLIAAHQSLIPSVMPLANLRSSQGMTVSVVDVEDIYDEFSYGNHGPQAIKDFLAFVSLHWTRAPRYVIFAGDASYDPRNYLGYGNRDFVPTKLVDATFNETASDDWLTDFDNDGIADIPVGRLPVGTSAEANVVVSKIVNFSPANVPQSALLVADAQGSYYFNFEQANTQVQSLLPSSMVVQRVDRRTEPSDAQAGANIIARLNDGQALLNYSGHGNVNTWTNAGIFTSENALALTNGNKLPFVVVMDCLNGYFQEPNPDPATMGLAEAFLQAPNGGAVAAFASSGLTIPDGQHAMGLQLYTLVYGSQSIALGDAIRIAKAATNDIDVRRTWIYFGDPSLKIR